MFARIFTSAAIAGLVTGLLWSLLQQVWAVPLILEAEVYEAAASASAPEASTPEASPGEAEGHEHDAASWEPEDGTERVFYTAIGNVILAIGYGLVLAACFALRGKVHWREGMLWGLAGFISLNLAPALGLPPELPGTEAAALGARQTWWLATVSATMIGLALMAFSPKWTLKTAGIGLMAVPHVIGAPHPEISGGLAPAELEQAFVVATLTTNGFIWLLLGSITAWLFGWPDRNSKGRVISTAA
jgi:cobalt transporter subunit CbtA